MTKQASTVPSTASGYISLSYPFVVEGKTSEVLLGSVGFNSLTLESRAFKATIRTLSEQLQPQADLDQEEYGWRNWRTETWCVDTLVPGAFV